MLSKQQKQLIADNMHNTKCVYMLIKDNSNEQRRYITSFRHQVKGALAKGNKKITSRGEEIILRPNDTSGEKK